MADGGVDIDLYADDIESDFNRQVSLNCVKLTILGVENVWYNFPGRRRCFDIDMWVEFLRLFQDEFGGENVDLYDDVIAAPSKPEDGDRPPSSAPSHNSHPPEETNGNSSYHNNGPSHHHGGRRFQLYIGNLTWVCT